MLHMNRGLIGARNGLVIALCLLGGVQSAIAQRSQLSTSEIATKTLASSVTISTAGGTGSGVILDPTGVVITNLHVVQGETDVSVKLPSSSFGTA